MRQFSDRNSALDIPPEAGALLMIEIDGLAESLDGQIQKIRAAVEGDPGHPTAPISLNVATTKAEIAALWSARKALSPTLRHVAPKKINEDVVVPVSRIPTLIQAIDQSAARHGITIVNFGHAGNGNIHVNLLIDPENPDQMSAAEEALAEIFSTVLALDGTLSGEHGVGAVKRDYVRAEISSVNLALMHGIKEVFDPEGIMNPDKKLPAVNP
jgi:D-lactate dehydrogenase